MDKETEDEYYANIGRREDAPRYPRDAMELLTYDKYAVPFLSKWSAPLALAVSGCAMSTLHTVWNLRRPIWSGLHKHIAYTVVGFAAGKIWYDYRVRQKSRWEEFMRQYVTAHPEDFPPFQHVKNKDLFLTWKPQR